MMTTMILIGFSLAVLMGAGLTSLLTQLKPQWSPKRRALAATAALPSITVFATLLALLWIWSLDNPGGGDVRGLAAAAMATYGLGFAILAFIGGLIGAMLAQARRVR